jgi:CBS domain-containing protein
MRVKDIMTAKVAACRPDTNLAAAAGLLWAHDCGALPVLDRDGKVSGMITDRDICMAVATKRRPSEAVRVDEVVSGRLFALEPEDSLAEALDTMRQTRVRRLPVVDAEGRLAGLLSITDIVRHAQNVRAGTSRVSYEQAMSTLKALCEQRSSHDPTARAA